MIGRVIVPTEKVREIRKSKKIETEQKFFPGYLLVEMELTDDTWHLVRSTPKVTGFVGSGAKPVAAARPTRSRASSADGGGRREAEAQVHLPERDKVRVIEGPFVNFQGAIDDLNPERGKLKVMVRDLRPADARRARVLPGGEALHGEESPGDGEAADHGREGQSVAAGGPGPRPARRQHHGVLQGLQRSDNSQEGLILPVVVTIYQDRSFTFVSRRRPAAILLKRAAGIAKASAVPHKDKIGKVTRAQVREIAQTKLVDLNTDSIDAAMRTVEGTARSMGIEVV